MTKTWQERFDELEILSLLNDKDPIYGEENQLAKYKLKQFISDLRKHDEQQLLLKLRLETQYYGKEIEMKISKIIEEYYVKN